METRDQWYKPNLLYNIHYRPPKKPEQPKMTVETVQFNPSACTCGEHGCQPQYRMEKRVLWTKKVACKDKQPSKIKGRENKDKHRENKFQESITKQDRKISSVIESKQMGLEEDIGQERRYIEGDEGKQMGLKEKNGQKCRLIEGDASKQIRLKEDTDQKCRFIKDDGNKICSAEIFQEKISGVFEVRSDYQVNCAVKEKENVEVHGGDDEKEEKKEGCVFNNEVGCSNSKNDVCIDDEARNTNAIKENNSNSRSDRDHSKVKNSEGDYKGKIIGNDSESDLSNDCKDDEKRSKEDQIEKNHTAGGNGTDDSDSAGYEAEYCSENISLSNNYDKIAESCSLEIEDGGLEDVEIASAFGIMTIYCKSELHSWSFKGEDT